MATSNSEKKAGLILESWKVPIFEKNLKAAGFKYAVSYHGNATSSVIAVYFERLTQAAEIHKICIESGEEAAKARKDGRI